jgi:hypothetical protein
VAKKHPTVAKISAAMKIWSRTGKVAGKSIKTAGAAMKAAARHAKKK